MLLMPRTNPDTGQTACGMVSLETIAAWGELLGTGSDVETVAAIMQAKDPGIIDRETARHAWTSAYEQVEHDALEDLNQVRAASLHRAFTPTGALAPDGRAETRRLLGLDSTVTDPYEADAAIAAAQAVAESTTDEPEPSIRLPAGVDATSLETLLAEHAAEIQTAREKFIDAITPPITDRR
ncbi:hypothetical protein BL1347_05315 [Bifidobacterium longum subsp. infantis]|nr:hypothetical protein [Bifidobacterium sp. WCA-178-WT-4B]OIN62541.1 hypothetical protein BFS25_08690 [Bifidobacterium longum subsp. infantis]QOL45648.1 hypothetical protein BL1347_05315 [Bifidobacterium longum subsp. infantis]